MLSLTMSGQVFAQAKDGEAEVGVGSTTQVAISSVYASTLARAKNVSAYWTASNSNISVESQTNTYCRIRGNRAGTANLILFH